MIKNLFLAQKDSIVNKVLYLPYFMTNLCSIPGTARALQKYSPSTKPKCSLSMNVCALRIKQTEHIKMVSLTS